VAGFDHAPPPFFKRGPAPLALLTFYTLLSLAVFVVDLRFRSLDLLRQSVALLVDPVQRVAQTPGSLVDYARNYLEGIRSLQLDNDELRHAKLSTAPNLLRLEQLEAENDRLRKRSFSASSCPSRSRSGALFSLAWRNSSFSRCSDCMPSR